jgi:hypothetical protein
MLSVNRYVGLVVLGLAAAASIGCRDSTPTLPSCTYSVSGTAVTFPAGGGSTSITVTTGPSCAWSASPTATWLTVTLGSSGTGNGVVTLSVAANGASPRSATLTIAGRTVTVSQDALRFGLSGKVTDIFLGSGPRGYLALSDVSVTVTGGPSQGSALTDWRGDYTVTGLMAGAYTVSFSKASYRTETATVDVSGATTLPMGLGLDVPTPLTASDLTGYWSGTGNYPNAPFKLALVQNGSTLRGRYLDGLDEGPAEVLLSPPAPLPPYSPTRFTLAVNFGDAILYLDCSVDGERRIIGAQRTSALGWNRTFPFTLTR